MHKWTNKDWFVAISVTFFWVFVSLARNTVSDVRKEYSIRSEYKAKNNAV